MESDFSEVSPFGFGARKESLEDDDPGCYLRKRLKEQLDTVSSWEDLLFLHLLLPA